MQTLNSISGLINLQEFPHPPEWVEVCQRGTFFQLKVSIQTGYLFCQNGIQKGTELDLGAEPPHIEFFRVPPPPRQGQGGA